MNLYDKDVKVIDSICDVIARRRRLPLVFFGTEHYNNTIPGDGTCHRIDIEVELEINTASICERRFDVVAEVRVHKDNVVIIRTRNVEALSEDNTKMLTEILLKVREWFTRIRPFYMSYLDGEMKRNNVPSGEVRKAIINSLGLA